MSKACEECTTNCVMVHKRKKNPASLVTTFFKVMMGDDYSKILFLPPKFACHIKNLVGKTTHLEDLNGEKWDVKVTRIDDRLAFGQGWNTFAINHRLQKGDFLVFHYVMKSHFVVLMYGSTGCPELRHFGFGQRPSKVNTKSDNISHESEPFIHETNDTKTINKKPSKVKMSTNEKNTANNWHLVASTSRPMDKEMDQRSDGGRDETEMLKKQIEMVVEKLKESTSNPITLEIVTESHESEPFVHGANDAKTINGKLSKVKMSANEKNTANDRNLIASNSRLVDKERDQKSDGGPDDIEMLETQIEMVVEKQKESTSIPTKRMEPIQTEPPMNHGSGGLMRKEPKTEPIDHDEAPLSFSAVMSSYQYLELPGWVKLKSKVILLRNGTEFWPVLYQTKYGLKALTRNWSLFANEKGIKPRDKCEFRLESEPNSRFTCSVFCVHVTR